LSRLEANAPHSVRSKPPASDCTALTFPIDNPFSQDHGDRIVLEYASQPSPKDATRLLRARRSETVTRLAPTLLAISLLLTPGCISTHIVQNKAKPHQEYDPLEKANRPVEGRPAYYALLPLTVVADIVTAPVQLILLASSGSGSASIDGWPIPLP
jgi:hypothetical protein